MGMMHIRTTGSFPVRYIEFGAMEHGHAHAVAEAIQFLTEVVLPAAIDQDHRLHDEGIKPTGGFERGADHG
jgi:hypothetical protein